MLTDLRFPLTERTRHLYTVKNPYKAPVRDLGYLIQLRAITVKRPPEPDEEEFLISIRLNWPTEITETEFFKRVKAIPKGKVYGFLSM